jgi:hypothetical protein
MYSNGEGVPQDDVQAYKWFSLAVVWPGRTSASKLSYGLSMVWLVISMTSEQIAEAQALAAEWWEDYQSRQ